MIWICLALGYKLLEFFSLMKLETWLGFANICLASTFSLHLKTRTSLVFGSNGESHQYMCGTDNRMGETEKDYWDRKKQTFSWSVSLTVKDWSSQSFTLTITITQHNRQTKSVRQNHSLKTVCTTIVIFIFLSFSLCSDYISLSICLEGF